MYKVPTEWLWALRYTNLKKLFPFFLYSWTKFTEQITNNNSKWFLYNPVSFNIKIPVNILFFFSIHRHRFQKRTLSDIYLCHLEFWMYKGMSAQPKKWTKSGLQSRIMSKPCYLKKKTQLCAHSWFVHIMYKNLHTHLTFANQEITLKRERNKSKTFNHLILWEMTNSKYYSYSVLSFPLKKSETNVYLCFKWDASVCLQKKRGKGMRNSNK